VQQELAVDYNVLGSLIKHTELLVPVVEQRQGLDSISRCSELVSICLGPTQEPARRASLAALGELKAFEWSSICTMTPLTALVLPGLSCAQFNQSSTWDLLSNLQQLQTIYAEVLPVAAVPALAQLPALEELMCHWEQGDGQQLPTTGNKCTSVSELIVLGGTPPFWAFPGLRDLRCCGRWEPSSFESLAKYCTGLEMLCFLCDDTNEQGQMRPWQASSFALQTASAPSADRCAALRKLAGLQQLRHLELAVLDDAEVAMLPAFHQLECLTVIVPIGSRCNVRAW
jgi:hypothetical protein